MNRSDPERIFARIVVTASGCWEYQRARNSKGYGVVSVNNKAYPAHRLAYELRKGAIPDGLLVCHTCDNPPCINPEHLFAGTHKDNIQDMIDKGRGDVREGELNPSARLTESDVLEVFEMRRSGHSRHSIASKLAIHRNYVNSILSGKAWPHITKSQCPIPDARCKATEAIVREIREMYAGGGWSYSQLGRKFGLSVPGVADIITRKNWKHIT